MANRKEFIDELALLANLSHPNIVQFLGAVTTHRPLVMVTEYLPNVGLRPLLLTFLLLLTFICSNLVACFQSYPVIACCSTNLCGPHHCSCIGRGTELPWFSWVLGFGLQFSLIQFIMFSSSQGDLYDVMEKKGKLDAGTSIRYALDIARFAIFQSSNLRQFDGFYCEALVKRLCLRFA